MMGFLWYHGYSGDVCQYVGGSGGILLFYLVTSGVMPIILGLPLFVIYWLGVVSNLYIAG